MRRRVRESSNFEFRISSFELRPTTYDRLSNHISRLGMMMFRYLAITTSILLVVLLDVSAQHVDPARAASAMRSIGDLPVSFVPNRGQVIDTRGDTRPDILYTASSLGTEVFVRSSVVSYVFQRRV